MTAVDEDALICDFAETYHIYNYRGLPLRYAAVLSCGLSEDSRIKRKLTGAKLTTQLMMQAAMVDALNILVWFKTKDAQKGRNRPKSIVELLTGESEKIDSFATVEEFERARSEIIGVTYGN